MATTLTTIDVTTQSCYVCKDENITHTFDNGETMTIKTLDIYETNAGDICTHCVKSIAKAYMDKFALKALQLYQAKEQDIADAGL